ncbi:hypothetical protein [Alicyclobacillus fastidiosus]|uniref:Uncharacterized protein n=1 Tax=Alicyclobacillus fastidiosus TaxID=392011 RepID=A0ABV5AM43_9BACL|nr:hypothetical protein [Alicyclobacillus fastidiosus]WEH11061.1 hypothetical protein PYS47_07540 [Alicyclobacillus fastidiosus]
MDIRWNIGEHREDDRIFDSLFEVDEWADAIAMEFLQGHRDGYITPDERVAWALCYFLARYDIMDNFKVHAAESRMDGRQVYKVWVTPIVG